MYFTCNGWCGFLLWFTHFERFAWDQKCAETLFPGNAETGGTIRQTTARGQKRDFHWRKAACQAPHCCYKSSPALTSCVDNIPTVCAPRPLFSLLRLLVGLQPKHGPLFIGSFNRCRFAARIGLGSLRNKNNIFFSVSLSSRAVLATLASLGGTRRCFTHLEGPLFTHVPVSTSVMYSLNNP